MNIVFDIETSDPDDALTLAILCTHPKANLVGVTVTPGSNHQIGVVKKILSKFDKNIPIGSYKLNYGKECVSSFHYKWLGNCEPKHPDDHGYIILNYLYKQFPDLEILTGGPLGNVGEFVKNFNPKLNRITIQGGFAGDSIVPKEYRLPKFDGKEFCPTFNLNGNVDAALVIIQNKNIKRKQFISKNVCHGISWEQETKVNITHDGLKLANEGMQIYLQKGHGKMMHDTVAMAAMLVPEIFEFKQVDLFRRKGEWGCRLNENSNNFISIHCDQNKFWNLI